MTRGKVGDIVFTRGDGEQVIRARNRQPRNPRTPLQMVSRVILKTSSSAYSRLQAICNHSFEGRESATANQARFIQLNNAMLQERVADILDDGSAELILSSTLANFAGRMQQGAVYNDYIISEGSINSFVQSYKVDQEGLIASPQIDLIAAIDNPVTSTYADWAAALGLMVGDQVSFVFLHGALSDFGEKAVMPRVSLARIILMPSAGDPSEVPFIDEEGYINAPNSRNVGNIKISVNSRTKAYIISDDIQSLSTDSNTFVAFAAVASRQSASGVWQRSTQSLLLNPFVTNYRVAYLGDAVASYMDAGLSSKYLNQAE